VNISAVDNSNCEISRERGGISDSTGLVPDVLFSFKHDKIKDLDDMINAMSAYMYVLTSQQ
jgi:hypothetical protein